jgi:arsenite/tail-anchored protein-transporting ATPase
VPDPVTSRTILYTGKGGVGKTSVAAATARRCAAQGARTIVVSTDPAHSLGDALGTRLGSGPTEVGEHLWAQQVEAQTEMEHNWAAVQDWLGALLVERGVDHISAEELTVPPGLDELFSLLQIKRHHEAGEFDVLVVDCAPTGETLRLLSFPDVARWWLEKIFPQQGQIMAAARPFARAVLDLNLPGDAVFDDVQRLVRNLIAMNEILRDRERVSIRLVMNPDRMVIDEARRTFTYLNLYGYLTDAVVVNRVFPAEVGDYFGAWREVQQDHLREVEAAFAPVPILTAPYFPAEVIGPEMLDRLGDELFADRDAAGVLHASLAHELDVSADGATIRLDLPLSEKGDISLKKIGLELVVRVNGHKRTLLLPPALAGYRPAEASFVDGALEVAFHPPEDVPETMVAVDG